MTYLNKCSSHKTYLSMVFADIIGQIWYSFVHSMHRYSTFKSSKQMCLKSKFYATNTMQVLQGRENCKHVII